MHAATRSERVGLGLGTMGFQGRGTEGGCGDPGARARSASRRRRLPCGASAPRAPPGVLGLDSPPQTAWRGVGARRETGPEQHRGMLRGMSQVQACDGRWGTMQWWARPEWALEFGKGGGREGGGSVDPSPPRLCTPAHDSSRRLTPPGAVWNFCDGSHPWCKLGECSLHYLVRALVSATVRRPAPAQRRNACAEAPGPPNPAPPLPQPRPWDAAIVSGPDVATVSGIATPRPKRPASIVVRRGGSA